MLSSMTTSARGSASIGSSDRRTRLEPFSRHRLVDLVHALGVARRQDQHGARHRRADAPERIEHRRLLALHRAARDDDRSRRRDSEDSAARDRARATGASEHGRSSESNLRLPGHGDAPGLAPRSMKRRADCSLCTQKLSMSSRTRA